jgi:hypothetical protein
MGGAQQSIFDLRGAWWRPSAIRRFAGELRPATKSPVAANSSESLQLGDAGCRSVRIS